MLTMKVTRYTGNTMNSYYVVCNVPLRTARVIAQDSTDRNKPGTCREKVVAEFGNLKEANAKLKATQNWLDTQMTSPIPKFRNP